MQTKTVQQVCRAVGLKLTTHSGLEPVYNQWIPLIPGRAVQYNDELEIARKWSQG